MNHNKLSEMLFQNQRFSILSYFVQNPGDRITSAYAFAWDRKIFPLLDGSDLHDPYEEVFTISGSKLSELNHFLADKWDANEQITFYELEGHYRCNYDDAIWDRSDLISACTYLLLHNHFDDKFWTVLLTNGQCPIEAFSINRPFSPSDIYFC